MTPLVKHPPHSFERQMSRSVCVCMCVYGCVGVCMMKCVLVCLCVLVGVRECACMSWSVRPYNETH